MQNLFKKYHLLLLFVFVGFGFGSAIPSHLQDEINQLNADPDLKYGSWSLCVITADSGKAIAEVNADKSLIPASTLKIFTTGAALKLLGTDFRFETTLETDGSYDSLTGTVNGNLIIKGSGDPTLDSKYFRQEKDSSILQKWAVILRKKGIKTITGQVIGDASLFGTNPLPDGWTWGDIGQYYGAGTCALTYRDNSYTLVYNTTGLGSARLLKTIPNQLGFTINSDVKIGGARDEAYVYGAPYGTVHYITGRIPKDVPAYEVDAALPDPALQCANDFYTALIASGIRIGNNTATTLRAQQLNPGYKAKTLPRHLLHQQFSPPLSEIVYYTNLKSDNIYAESLLRTLGRVKGNGISIEDGLTVVKEFWQKNGVKISGFFMTDGSGLSRSNAVTTRQQATALRSIISFSETEYAAFLASLPVAGKSGSLATIGKGTLAENNLSAKSGYITRARGYSGYVKTKSQKLLCFSILANNYSCTAAEMKKKLERILVQLAELP